MKTLLKTWLIFQKKNYRVYVLLDDKYVATKTLFMILWLIILIGNVVTLAKDSVDFRFPQIRHL